MNEKDCMCVYVCSRGKGKEGSNQRCRNHQSSFEGSLFVLKRPCMSVLHELCVVVVRIVMTGKLIGGLPAALNSCQTHTGLTLFRRFLDSLQKKGAVEGLCLVTCDID